MVRVQADKDGDGLSGPVLRREDRNPTNWIATIRLADGSEIPCTVKDVSKSGAKLGVPANRVLPETFLLRIIGRDFLCVVKLAWRRGDYAGVRIERVGKVSPPPVKETAPPAPVLVDGPERAIEAGGIGVRSRRRRPSSF